MRRWLTSIGVVVAVVVVAAFLIGLGYEEEQDVAGEIRAHMGTTGCLRARGVVLTAQTLPSAELVPCLTDAVSGWRVDSSSYSSDGTFFELSTEKVLGVSWSVSYTATCTPDPNGQRTSELHDGVRTDVTTTTEDMSSETGVVRHQWFQFPGGCLESQVTVPGFIDRDQILGESDRLLVLVNRQLVDDEVHRLTNGEFQSAANRSEGSPPI